MTTQGPDIKKLLVKKFSDCTRDELLAVLLHYRQRTYYLKDVLDELGGKYDRCFIATTVIVLCFIGYITIDLWK